MINFSNPLKNSQKALEDLLRRHHQQIVYLYKTHQKDSDLLVKRFLAIKWWQIILSILALTGLLSMFIGFSNIGMALSATVSAALLVINTITINDDLGGLAQKHKQAAEEVWLLREQYLSLLTDTMSRKKPLNELQKEHGKLQEKLHSLNSPRTSTKAYEIAKEALEPNRIPSNISAEELDNYLKNC